MSNPLGAGASNGGPKGRSCEWALKVYVKQTTMEQNQTTVGQIETIVEQIRTIVKQIQTTITIEHTVPVNQTNATHLLKVTLKNG